MSREGIFGNADQSYPDSAKILHSRNYKATQWGLAALGASRCASWHASCSPSALRKYACLCERHGYQGHADGLVLAPHSAVLQQANVGRSICCSGLIMEHEWNCASCWITTERNNETVKHRNNSCGIRMPFFKQACVFLFVLTFLVCLSVQLWVSYSFPEHHFDWLQPPMNGQSIICLCLA